jgi:SAM-dependent methyltransferase
MPNSTNFVGVNGLLVTNVITFVCLLFLLVYYKIPKKIIRKIIEPKYCKSRFLKRINHKGKLLDVGCGNNSPYRIKTKYPDIIYTGIDVGDYNQTKPNIADNYIVVKPENFAEAIDNMQELFDTIISSHNLEHCNDRDRTLDAMIKVLSPGGYLYLSFPTEESINFPPRKGTLNYYDDPTHKDKPPEYDKIISKLKANNMEILFADKSYKPLFGYLRGLLLEWKSKKDKRLKPGIWAYWGFETIIWAKKNKSARIHAGG